MKKTASMSSGGQVTERGSVREVRGNLVIIDPGKNAACFGCMNQECKSSKGLITAENPKALPIEAGQTVEVEANGVSIAKQSITAFLPPILFFIAGYSIMRVLFWEAGEGAAAFTGAILLFASALIIFRLRGKKPASCEFFVTRIIKMNKPLLK